MMSINYVKCLDLIPQAVVLVPALEPGMDPGTCRARGAMYEQLRRAFKVAGSLGLWRRATNGILHGCPLTVTLLTILTTMQKREINSITRQACLATAVLLPALGEADSHTEDGKGPSDPYVPPLVDRGTGYAVMGSSGYADDTHAVAPRAAPLQVTRAREAWLRVTRQDVCVDKSCRWI